jgi:hypothetical protein
VPHAAIVTAGPTTAAIELRQSVEAQGREGGPSRPTIRRASPITTSERHSSPSQPRRRWGLGRECSGKSCVNRLGSSKLAGLSFCTATLHSASPQPQAIHDHFRLYRNRRSGRGCSVGGDTVYTKQVITLYYRLLILVSVRSDPTHRREHEQRNGKRE